MLPWERPHPDVWRVVCTAPLPEAQVRRFVAPDAAVEIVIVEPRTESAAVQAMRGAHIVIGDYVFDVPITRVMLEQLTDCRLIQQPSTGYQQIDVVAAAELGIPVANVAGANDASVAEHTVMVALALLRQLLLSDREVRRGNWPQLDRPRFDLAGKSWGIVGFGRTGRRLAERLQGWGVELAYFDAARAPADVESALQCTYTPLDDLLARSDVVSLHVPLVDATWHLIDAGSLARMKPAAVLINVARGEVVDTAALVAALQAGALRGAALDVFEDEPLVHPTPFAELDNVVLTPHVAGTTQEARVRLMKMTAANVQRVMRGEQPIDIVNGIRG